MKTYEERMVAVEQKLQRKKTQRKVWAVTACTLCLCIVAGIFFIPFGNEDISQYENSEYYKVIEAINRDFPNYKNDGLIWAEDDVSKDDLIYEAGPPGATPDGDIPNSSNNSSVEITDHQVAGVLEADIIKRSQTHIFYLKDYVLEVYPIAGLETELLSYWKIPTVGEAYYYSIEMYLSEDATRINLILSGAGKVFESQKWEAFVQLISLDVSDPENIQKENCVYITGSLKTVRMVGENILVMSHYYPDSKIDFDDVSTFLPRVGEEGKMKTVPGDKIVVPDKLNQLTYTVVTMLDSRELTVIDSGAFMSYSDTIYVSQDRIYATRSYMAYETLWEHENKSLRQYTNMSEISCMTYNSEGLELAGSFQVEGSVGNQYHMDEHNGIFRVVTETFHYQHQLRENGTVEMVMNREQNANLYCFQVGTWEQKALVESFAPDGETVESVRFDGDYAYVCTAVVVTLTDPVFFFDMTDLENIIVKDTGEIDGYSSSLVQLGGGLLLGIGMDDQRNLKVEIYRETENGVESVCMFNQNVGSFPTVYKAYYIDRERNLFGIPTGEGYILLMFDGYQLAEIARADFTGYGDYTRGVVIEKFLYVFGERSFDVVKLA